MIKKLSLVLFLSAASLSHASDVTLKSKNLDSQNNEVGIAYFYFTTDKICFENESKNEKSAFIFDSSTKEFIFIDHVKKEYYQVTEAELQEFVAQLRQLIPMMKAFMGNLPPAQQEKLKKQFGPLLGGEQVETKFNKKGSGVKVNKWLTDQYEAIQGNNKIAEMFLASYGNLGLKKDDFKSYQAMRLVFGEIIAEFAGVLPIGASFAGLTSNFDENPAFEEGIPVRSLNYKDGKLAMENVIQSISKEDIGRDKFETPKGYKRKKMELPQMR